MKIIQPFEICENELRISEKIREIPYFFSYFSPIESYKILKISEIDEYFLESSEFLGEKKYILVSKESAFYPSFSSFFDNLTNPKEKVRFLLDSYTYLLKSINVLSENGLVYFDLSDEKIVFNKKKQPILNNFSQSFSLHDDFLIFERIFNKYDPSTFALPLEVQILTFINDKTREKKSISQTDIEEICKAFIVKNQALRGFSDEFIKNYFNSCVLQALSFSIVNEPREKIVEKIIKHANTWDNYSLSAFFLSIIYQIQIHDEQGYVYEFLTGLSQILLLNIDPNPEKRLTCQQTIEKIEDLLVQLFYTFSHLKCPFSINF
jgi:hypothetical protein